MPLREGVGCDVQAVSPDPMSHTSIFPNSRRPKQARSKRASLQGFRDRVRPKPSLCVVACEGSLGLRSLPPLPFTGSTLQRTQPQGTTGSELHYNRPTVASRYGVIFILISSVMTQVKSICPSPSGHALHALYPSLCRCYFGEAWLL